MNNIKSITPQLTEIKNYTPALKIGDQYFVNGIGGNFIPGGASTGSMEFYRCSYVNSDSWGGYKAIQDPLTGKYTLQSIVTPGLHYSQVTPVIGRVYANGTFAEAALFYKIPTDNLVFYATFSDSSQMAATGQALTFNQNHDITTGIIESGVACCKTAAYGGDTWTIKTSAAGFPAGSDPCSMSMWIKLVSGWDNVNADSLFWYGGDSCDGMRAFGVGRGSSYDQGNSFGAYIGCNDNGWCPYLNITGWHHICVCFDGSYAQLYVDGNPQTPVQHTLNTPSSSDLTLFWNRYADIYFAAARVYSRVLLDYEVCALASEFTTTQA